MTAPLGPGREVEEPLELRRGSPPTLRVERLAVEQVALASSARTGRRSSRSRRRRARPAGRRGAAAGAARRSGTRWPTWSESAGRIEADVAGDRAAGRQAGRQARASWRAGCPRHSSSASEPAETGRRGRAVTASSVEPSRPDREAADPFVHAPYAIVRPLMQTSLARRQRHRRALQRRPQGADADSTHRSSRSSPSSSSSCSLAASLRRGRARRRRRRLQLLRRGPARPGRRADEHPVRAADDHLRPDRQDRAGPPRRRSSARSSPSTRCPARSIDATTAIEDKDFWTNAGFDPVGIVSAGLDTISGPAARRLDDHPAARPRPAPAADGVRGLDVRAQDRARSSSRSG